MNEWKDFPNFLFPPPKLLKQQPKVEINNLIRCCSTSYCQGQMFCCQTRLLFIMRAHKGPHQPFSFSVGIITKSFRLPRNTFNQSLHDITFSFGLCFPFIEEDGRKFKLSSYWIQFEWQDCVHINYDEIVRLFTLGIIHTRLLF